MRIEIVPFGDNYVEDAARLLALRHQRDRLKEPALPARFCDPSSTRLAVEASWHKPHASGVVALQAGRVVGYLIGALQVDSFRGRSVRILLAGHALDANQDVELYRDLYAALSPQWLALGYFAHYILVPATDKAALDIWFALCFGQEQAHGIRETTTDDLSISTGDPTMTIRRAGPDDLDAVLAMSEIVHRYQAGPPIYSTFLPESQDNVRKTYIEILNDPTAVYWMAQKGQEVLGYQLYTPGEPADDNLLEPEQHFTYLNLAATRPEARGQGVGQALTVHALRWAQAQGDTLCGTDWRTTNLRSSRFWPRQGFRPVAYGSIVAWMSGLLGDGDILSLDKEEAMLLA